MKENYSSEEIPSPLTRRKILLNINCAYNPIILEVIHYVFGLLVDAIRELLLLYVSRTVNESADRRNSKIRFGLVPCDLKGLVIFTC